MGLFSFLKKKDEKIEESFPSKQDSNPQSYNFIGNGRIGYNPIIDDHFDGEKTPGELGAVYNSTPEYLKLRLRAYDMNLKTDIVKIITGKFFKWVIGSGLKIQVEPSEQVLKLFGVPFDRKEFSKNVEPLFELYANSKYSDYHNIDSLHEKAIDAYKTSFLGGDCLCVIRFNKYGPNIQVIDGQQIKTPFDEKGKVEGNTVKHGIEMNKKGEHVAFFVRTSKPESVIDLSVFEYERIEAKNSNDNLVAWMIYGNKERIDHHRGIPVITSILEKIGKLDRFVEASVTKAEQSANVVYAFQHGMNSTGENILTQQLTSKKGTADGEETTYEKNGRTAAALRQSTKGMVMNLAPDSQLVSLSNPNETSFNEFFRAVFVGICASVDLPEEFALQKYDQNYSSSRAAINGVEFVFELSRKAFAKKFYAPFYRAWLEWQVLNDTIKIPGFLEAKNAGKFMALEAFYSARFTGKKMPHIDPLKEAKAVREMLGGDTAAIISHEQAAEMLGAGDWLSNYTKFLEEKTLIPKEEQDDVKDKNNSKNKSMGNNPKK